MAERLLNKVAVITGAGGGIGRAIAEKFLGEGAKVVLVGRNRGPLEEVASLAPARVLAVEADVTQSTALRSAATAASRRFGKIDVLVPNAGIARFAPLLDCELETAREQIETNLFGALRTVQEFADSLNTGAAVLFVTASSCLTTTQGLGIHAATKAALRAVAQSLAHELASRGMRVNCIAPGPTKTPLWRPIEKAATGKKNGPARLAGRSADLEFGSPHDIAEAAVFLASEAAEHIRGQEFVIDGTGMS